MLRTNVTAAMSVVAVLLIGTVTGVAGPASSPAAAAADGWDVTVTPPALQDPTHITLTAASPTERMPAWGILCSGVTYMVRLGPDEDAIIDFAGSKPLPYPLWVVGGRNVHIIGLDMDMVVQPGCGIGELPNTGSTARSIHPRLPGGMAVRLQNHGTSFVEGVDLDLRGHEADCFVVRNPRGMTNEQARIQRHVVLQNTNCRGIEGLGPSSIGDGVHGDLIQNQGEVMNSLILENVSVRTSMEGIVLHEWGGYPGARFFQMRRFDYAADERYADDDEFEQWGVAFAAWAEVWDLQDVYIADPKGNDYGFINNQRWGGFELRTVRRHPGIHRGLPPQTSFAPESMVGAHYVSPHGTRTTSGVMPGSSRSHQIVRLYQAAFGRAPDAAGLAYWSDRYHRGHPLSAIASHFRLSDEWSQRYGAATGNPALVDAMYRNVLRRGPDPAGRAYWLQRLDSGELNPVRLLMFFSESPENVNLTRTRPPTY